MPPLKKTLAQANSLKPVIALDNAAGFKWRRIGLAYAKGLPFRNGCLISLTELVAALITPCGGVRIDALKELDGAFAVVYFDGSRCILLSDHCNTFPVYYRNDFSVVADSSALKRLRVPYILDFDAATSFLYSCNVWNDGTLWKGWKKTEPGCVIDFQYTDGTKTKSVYHTLDCGSDEMPDNSFLENCYDYTRNMLYQLSKSFSNIVVPLSGGYDSRHILLLLKECGAENVQTYFVGSLNSPSLAVSWEIAQRLGYPWCHVVYNNRYWTKAFRSKARSDYSWYSGGIHTMAYHLDWPAVRDLHDDMCGQDTLFLPGYGGDFLAGSAVTKEVLHECSELKDVVRLLMKNYVRNPILKVHHRLLESLLSNTIAPPESSNPEFKLEFLVNEYERFLWRNKYCNHVMNAVRAYEFFGNAKWALPLANKTLINGLYSCRPSRRVNRFFYKEYCSRINDEIFSNIVTMPDREPTGVAKCLISAVKCYARKTILSPYFFIEPWRLPLFWFLNCAYQNSIGARIELREKRF